MEEIARIVTNTDNYHPSAKQCFIASSRSLYWFSTPDQPYFKQQQATKTKSYSKPTACFLLSIKQQTDKISNTLVNTFEHLATKEPDTFFRGWYRPKYWTYIRQVARDSTPNNYVAS